jgi:hypothetical protein
VAFIGNTYPAHITALLRLDAQRLLNEAGFDEITHTFSDHGGVPRWPTVSWQQVSVGRLRGLRYSDNWICTARKPT